MIELETGERKALIKLLVTIPEMQTERSRRIFLENAGLKLFLTRIELSGNTATVVGDIVIVLSNYGSLTKGDTALGKFLLAIKEYTGEENQEFIDDLIAKYKLVKSEKSIDRAIEKRPNITTNRISEQQREELEYKAEEQEWYVANFPETEEIAEAECEIIKSEIDVVLIVAAEIELKAVANLLKPLPQQEKIFLVYSGPETYYIGQFGAWKSVITKCRMGSISEGAVILATEQAQRLWAPRAIIMVGIAFGKDFSKQKIGDVLVASQIISYEQQRIGQAQNGEIEIIPRGSIPPSNTTLLNRFENIPNWKFTLPDGSAAKILVGPILSGEKLVDNPSFKAQLFKQFPQAIGGEMEGAGLCAASGRVGTAWILVKSICDWGDGLKHKKHQPLAAASAADLVHHVLSQKTVLRSLEKK